VATVDLFHIQGRVGSEKNFDVVNDQSRSPTCSQELLADVIKAVPIAWRRVAAVDEEIGASVDSGDHRHSRG